jgi:hypothetical protein
MFQLMCNALRIEAVVLANVSNRDSTQQRLEAHSSRHMSQLYDSGSADGDSGNLRSVTLPA